MFNLPQLKRHEPSAPLPPLHQSARSGDIDAVSGLLDQNDNPNTPDADGATALFWAAVEGHAETARRLLERGANPNLPNLRGETALWVAVRYSHTLVARLLLDAGANRDIYLAPDPNDTRPPTPESERIMREAGQFMGEQWERFEKRIRRTEGDQAAAQWRAERNAASVKSDAEVRELYRKPRRANLLMYAIRSGNEEMVRTLLEAGEKPVGPENSLSGTGPLALALMFGTPAITAALLEYGADPNQGVPLFQPTFTGNYDLVRLLLEAGADPNRREENSERAVTVALMRGDARMLDLLMEFGGRIELDATDDENHTSAQHQAFLRDAPDLQAVVRRRQETGWMDALEKGDLIAVRAALDQGADTNGRRDDDKTALLLALERGDTALCQLLIARGANVNLRGEGGRSTLHEAVIKKNLPFARLLLQAGADVNQTSSDGRTPLNTACMGRHFEIADLLEAHGANVTPCELALRGETVQLRRLWEAGSGVDTANPAGMTALLGAAARGNLPLMTDLLERGANFNHADNTGHPALYYAVLGDETKNATETVRFLLERGANAAATDKSGTSLLNLFLMANKLDAARLLLDAGAPIGHEEGILREHLMHSALLWDSIQESVAAQMGAHYTGRMPTPAPERMRLLLDRGGDPDAVGRNGETLLTSAIEKKAFANAVLLIERGANVNLPNDDDKTPLILALEAGNEGITRRLVKAGANVNQSWGGITPHDVAERTLPQLIGWLQKQGAHGGHVADGDTLQGRARRMTLDALVGAGTEKPLWERVTDLLNRKPE